MNSYLGYTIVVLDVRSDVGRYDDFIICQGTTVVEVITDYLKKLGRTIDPAKISLFADSSNKFGFKYTDEYVTHFIKLPCKTNKSPSDTLELVSSDCLEPYTVRWHVGDRVYMTKTEAQLRCHCGCFRPDPPDVPIERVIHQIIISADGIKYQLKGCGTHITDKDFGVIVFDTYEDAYSAMHH